VCAGGECSPDHRRKASTAASVSTRTTAAKREQATPALIPRPGWFGCSANRGFRACGAGGRPWPRSGGQGRPRPLPAPTVSVGGNCLVMCAKLGVSNCLVILLHRLACGRICLVALRIWAVNTAFILLQIAERGSYKARNLHNPRLGSGIEKPRSRLPAPGARPTSWGSTCQQSLVSTDDCARLANGGPADRQRRAACGEPCV
jgi:hypothetical protein